MLTPAFELSQDEKFVYVYIKTPYIKISDVDYFIDENQFKFYVKPYFLRLNFPGKVFENGEESASYDVDKGLFTVRLPKLVEGAHFPDLDLVTKLLAPSGKCCISTPAIEVISTENKSADCAAAADDNDGGDGDDDDEFDWEWGQEIYDEEKEQQLSVVGCKYGFANQKSGVFYRLRDELKDVVENPNPDELSFSERRLARVVSEDEKFDEEHYLADFFEDERIKEILGYVHEKEDSFSEDEKERLRQLPNREYIFDHKEEISVFYSLVDIIYAFAYNKRTTLGENTVESAWTISKLSSTLSWFETYTNLDDVVTACIRRSLSYPLFRHWNLSCKILQDVRDIFQVGRRKILKCLLEILTLFNASEPRYLLNELYITDYCIWIQEVKEKRIESLTKRLLERKITKDMIGWDLKNLETAAIIVYNEEKSRTSDSESRSDESTDDEDDETEDDDDETEGDDSTDIHSTVEETVPQKVLTSSEETGFSDLNVKNDALCETLGDLSIENDSKESKDETVRKVEVLPSLLFARQSFDGKKLVETIGGDEGSNDCGSVVVNAKKNETDKAICKDTTEMTLPDV